MAAVCIPTWDAGEKGLWWFPFVLVHHCPSWPLGLSPLGAWMPPRTVHAFMGQRSMWVLPRRHVVGFSRVWDRESVVGGRNRSTGVVVRQETKKAVWAG